MFSKFRRDVRIIWQKMRRMQFFYFCSKVKVCYPYDGETCLKINWLSRSKSNIDPFFYNADRYTWLFHNIFTPCNKTELFSVILKETTVKDGKVDNKLSRIDLLKKFFLLFLSMHQSNTMTTWQWIKQNTKHRWDLKTWDSIFATIFVQYSLVLEKLQVLHYFYRNGM